MLIYCSVLSSQGRNPLQGQPHFSERIKLAQAQQLSKLTSGVGVGGFRKGPMDCSAALLLSPFGKPPHPQWLLCNCIGSEGEGCPLGADWKAFWPPEVLYYLSQESSFSTWPPRSGPFFSSTNSLLHHCLFAFHPRGSSLRIF